MIQRINRYKWSQKNFDVKLNVLFLEPSLCAEFLVFKKLKHITIILFCHFYLSQNSHIDHWTPNGWHFFIKINAILHKMLKLGFQNVVLISLKSKFLVATFCLYLWLFLWVDICIINIWKWVRVLAEPFIKSKILWHAQNFQ